MAQRRTSSPSRAASRSPNRRGAVRCSNGLLRLPDDEAFVVYRGARCSAMLNAYPYTNGHLLVLPNRAVEELSELDTDEMAELWSVVRDAVAALRGAYGATGSTWA